MTGFEPAGGWTVRLAIMAAIEQPTATAKTQGCGPSPPSRTERTLGCAGPLPPAPRQRSRNFVMRWSASSRVRRLNLQGLSAFELGGVFGSFRRIAGAIGMCAHTREFAALHDQIFVADRTVLEVTLEDLPGACCVARLR